MSENKDNQYSFLENNANAVRAVMSAVDNTIGPKGLDTMLVDQFGQVVITNDGVTILREMAVSHPVAKMLINAVKAQPGGRRRRHHHSGADGGRIDPFRHRADAQRRAGGSGDRRIRRRDHGGPSGYGALSPASDRRRP